MVPVMLSLLALSAHAEDYWPAGQTIDDAASIQLTRAGLNAVAAMAPGLVPGSFDIPDQGDSGGGGFCLFEYEYAFTNGWVGMDVDDVRIEPKAGELELQADLTVWVNDASDKFRFSYDALCMSGNCPGYVDPFPVTVTAPITLEVKTDAMGEPWVDATVGEIGLVNGLEGKHIKFDGSGCLQNIEEILNYVGLSLYDFILDMVEPFLISMIQDYRADIEAQIEDALAAARYDGTVDVGGIPLSIKLYPRDVIVTTQGVEVIAAGRMSAPHDPCTDRFAVPGSLKTATPPPAITANPPGSQAVLHLSDDIANQALHALWDGGLLCYELSADNADISLPVPLNTSLLSILSAEFDPLFPETKPLIVKTAPTLPPRVDYEGDHDVGIQVRGLDVNFFTEIDHRVARAVGITITADAGVDVAFDGSTGLALVDVELGTGSVKAEATHNEIVPSAKDEIEENFSGLIDTLLGTLLGSALEDLSFGLPSADGMGLTSLDLFATGGGDWLGGFAKIGPVTYGGEGGGCEGSGCAATGGASVGWLALLLPLVLRRRR